MIEISSYTSASYISLSRDLLPQVVGITEEGDVVRDTIPLKGASLNAYLKSFAALMMLEGDRRKLRVELERQKRIDADALREYLRCRDIEGIVWHHPDGRMVKIKGKDFGFRRT